MPPILHFKNAYADGGSRKGVERKPVIQQAELSNSSNVLPKNSQSLSLLSNPSHNGILLCIARGISGFSGIAHSVMRIGVLM
jgi:hypothetical protein